MGPTSLLRGKTAEKHKEFASSITLRYSDAPKDVKGVVMSQKNNKKHEIEVEYAQESSYLEYRI